MPLPGRGRWVRPAAPPQRTRRGETPPSSTIPGVAGAVASGIAGTAFGGLVGRPPSGSSGSRPRTQRSERRRRSALAYLFVAPAVTLTAAFSLLPLGMLAWRSLFNLPDFLRGPMVNPFYHDLGLTKSFVGSVRGTLGLMGSFCGIAAGGFVAARFGITKALVTGGILQACFIASFALLSRATFRAC